MRNVGSRAIKLLVFLGTNYLRTCSNYFYPMHPINGSKWELKIRQASKGEIGMHFTNNNHSVYVCKVICVHINPYTVQQSNTKHPN